MSTGVNVKPQVGKMRTGCGGLGSDPDAVERIDAPGRGMPLPQVAPHSSKVFDEMHGKSGQPDDREAQTATIARIAVVAHRQGDDDTVRAMGEALLLRIRGHSFTAEEKVLLATVAERRRARMNGTDVSKFMRQIHGEAKRHIITMIAANAPVTYEDAIKAVEP